MELFFKNASAFQTKRRNVLIQTPKRLKKYAKTLHPTMVKGVKGSNTYFRLVL